MVHNKTPLKRLDILTDKQQLAFAMNATTEKKLVRKNMINLWLDWNPSLIWKDSITKKGFVSVSVENWGKDNQTMDLRGFVPNPNNK